MVNKGLADLDQCIIIALVKSCSNQELPSFTVVKGKHSTAAKGRYYRNP